MTDIYTQIEAEEGFRARPYECTEGVLTFGHGLTYITEDESRDILHSRIAEICGRLNTDLPYFSELSTPRKAVLAGLAFQVGYNGLMKFKKMLAAVEKKDWITAKSEALDSKWAAQTPKRAFRMAEQLASGAWANARW